MNKQTQPALLILAAGIGSRYGGLKQIDPVGPSGESIMDYSVYDAVRAGFNKIVFVIREEIEQEFQDHVVSKYSGTIDIEYVFQALDKLPAGFFVPGERVKPWGTAHAVLMARSIINQPFVVINADDFYGKNAFQLTADYLKQARSDTEYCMVGFILRNTLSKYGSVSRGVCEFDQDLYLKEIMERLKVETSGQGAHYIESDGAVVPLSGDEIASMNMWGFFPSIFDYIEKEFENFLANKGHEQKSEFFIPLVIDSLIKHNQARVKILKTEDTWFGITYQEDKPYVIKCIKELIEKGTYQDKLDYS